MRDIRRIADLIGAGLDRDAAEAIEETERSLGARVVRHECSCGARFRTAEELYDHCEEEQTA
jgi:hypothetical protein